jgi:3-phenylpropionate/cinnamic acid dioxygenase small subunit
MPASTLEAAAEAPTHEFRRISAADPAYGEVVNFLTDEVGLLDDDRHTEWLGLLATDISYRMPVRNTLYRKDGKGFDEHAFHFNDNLKSLNMRVKRTVDVPSAFDRDPAPRIRRLVTNFVVHEAAQADEYAATSYILMLRNRFNDPRYDMLSGRREDVVRRTPEGLRLARRVVLLDQAALGAAWLNVFM